MQKVGYFEKVSYPQYKKDMQGYFCNETDLRKSYDGLKMPRRATKGSAGYDFKAPFTFMLDPGETIKFPTGVKVIVNEGWWLGCLPRSSLGFKYRAQLDNTMGVIDSDYFQSDNEGHIFAKITNCGDRPLIVQAGDGFMQGIFLPYGITNDDDAEGVRNGGMGSTGA